MVNIFAHINYQKEVLDRFGIRIFLVCQPNDYLHIKYAMKKIIDWGHHWNAGSFPRHDLWETIDNRVLLPEVPT